MSLIKFSFLLTLLLSAISTTFSQTKLLVFSEEETTFNARLKKDLYTEKVSDFFVFDNIKKKEQTLEVTVSKQVISKQLHLRDKKQYIYALTKEKGIYKIRFRGLYNLDETLPVFNYSSSSVKTLKPIRLISITPLLNSLDKYKDSEIKQELINKRLNGSNFNCRQLFEIFSKINEDSVKVQIFEQNIDNCFDPQNFEIVMKSVEEINNKNSIKEIALKKLNQF